MTDRSDLIDEQPTPSPSEAPGAIPAPGNVLDGPLAELRERAIRLLGESAEQVGAIPPDGAADRQRLLDAANDLREMFLLVTIIGEFNAGKSTFVNALLGENLLATGITPTTDMIEVIRHAPQRGTAPTVRDAAIREWTHPNTGGPGVAIVDTPGTGSVFQKHEQIAKSFLHRSDLVIFLLSAKRAFADTERLYLELARSYGKKVIVVINQADLLEDRERREVERFVQQQIDQLLNLRPPIFTISARKALQKARGAADTGSAGALSEADEFGMHPLRAHLKTVFAQIPPAKQKLITRLDLLKSIVARHQTTVQNRLGLVGHDTDSAQALQHEIEGQAASLDRQLDTALAEVKKVLADVRSRGEKFIDENVHVLKATFRGLDRDKLAAEFEREVLAEMPTRIGSAQEHYVSALVDGSRAYWRGVIERLGKLDALLREESAGMDTAAYADQRAALQAALTLADIELKAYSDNKVIQDIQSSFDNNTRGFAYSLISGTGGIVAVLLSLAGVAAPGAAIPPLAVVGFVLGIPALIGGSALAVAYSRRAVREAKTQLDERLSGLESTYRQSLVKLTADERNRLLQYGRQILSPVFNQLQAVATRYRDQNGRLTALQARAEEIAKALEELKG